MMSRRVCQTIVLVLSSTVLSLNFFIPISLAQELSEIEKIEEIYVTT